MISKTRQKKSSQTKLKIFPGILNTMMEKNSKTQISLHRDTGIPVSRINSYCKGNYRTINPDHLNLIVHKVSKDKLDRAEIVKFYILDQVPMDLKPYIEISTLPEPKSFENWYTKRNSLPKSFEKTLFRLFKLCAISQTIRKRTAVWVEIMEETFPYFDQLESSNPELKNKKK